MSFILNVTYVGLQEELTKVGPPFTIVVVSCLSGIIQHFGSKAEPRTELERAMGSICQSLHGLVGRFPTMRILIAQPTPKMEVNHKINCTFALVIIILQSKSYLYNNWV